MPKAKSVAKKEIVKKPAVKAAVKPVVKSEPKSTGLTVDVYSASGRKSGTINLPKEIFGGKINKILMSQAVRVYMANQRLGTASTKTRGEVEGSSRKIYKQKGTGRARHGSIRANIFVKGGIVFGPKPRDFGLSFPKKMKKAAVISALSSKAHDGEIVVLSGFEKIEPKTKVMASVMKTIAKDSRKSLLITGNPKDGMENLYRASRNIKDLEILSANLLNTYEILKSRQIFLTKQAIDSLTQTYAKEK